MLVIIVGGQGKGGRIQGVHNLLLSESKVSPKLSDSPKLSPKVGP